MKQTGQSGGHLQYVYMPNDILGALTVTMAILARLGVNVAANIGFQYAAEMLPTVVRAQGVSLIHIIGYIAHIVGPYVIYLVSIVKNSDYQIIYSADLD